MTVAVEKFVERADRPAKRDDRRANPGRPDGSSGRNRRRRDLSGVAGSGLCHGRNYPYQWRDGDDMTTITIA